MLFKIVPEKLFHKLDVITSPDLGTEGTVSPSGQEMLSEPKFHHCFPDIPSLVWQIAVNGASDKTADAGDDNDTRIRRCDSAGLATTVPWM